MRVARACPFATVLVLALPSLARAGPAPAPQARPAALEGQHDELGPVRVVLVRPADADAITAEALYRIQGELSAEGFAVVLVDAPAPARPDDGAANGPAPRTDGAATPDKPPEAGAPPAQPASPPAEAGATRASGVSIKLSLDASTHVVELVVAQGLRSRKVTRSIDTRDAPPDRLAEVLAVRAVEFVHATLVELALPSARPPPACPPAPKPAEPSPARWALEAGMSVLVSPGSVGPAALPMARLRFAPIPRMELRLAAAGLGTSPRIEGPVSMGPQAAPNPGAATPGPNGASARVAQRIVAFEIALRPWPDLRVRPSFALTAGALQVSAEGEAAAPYQGIAASAWAAIVGGGAGVEVLVGSRFGVATELRAFASIPRPSVRFLGEEAARVVEPGLLASLTLVGWP